MGNRKRPKTQDMAEAKSGNETVILAYVHPGQVSSYFLASRENLLMYEAATSRRIVGSLNEWSSANISDSRNSLVRQFLDHPTQADWLFFMDADMSFDHDALDRLLAAADPEERPIVGGLCFGATFGQLFPTIYQLTEVDGKVKVFRVSDYPVDELVQCVATGAAFLLIHRRVFEAMRDRQFNVTFPWFQETEVAGQPCGEDITFCLRAGQMQIPVFVDTSIKVGHHKSIVLDAEMFQAQKQAKEVPDVSG